MRPHIEAFVELAATALELQGPVYEFGALQVEGSGAPADMRPYFPGRQFIGCDLRPGPGVDRVEDLGGLNIPDETAKTILCLDTLEHVFEARQAMREMIRVLSPGGVLLVAVPLEFRIHDYPQDYWRFTPACIDRLLEPLPATMVAWQGDETYPHTVFGLGVKAPIATQLSDGVALLIERYQQWLAQQRDARPWNVQLKSWLSGLFSTRGERRRQREYYEARFLMKMPIAQGRPSHHAAKRFAGSRLEPS